MPAKAVSPKRLWVVAGLAAALTCLLACGLGAFWAYRTIAGDPPGQGDRAQRGYQATAPIIAAREKYRQAHGQYPAALDAPVPDDLAAIPAAVNGYPITYQAASGSYTLEFSYTGPGMNHCIYTPATLWKCGGYY